MGCQYRRIVFALLTVVALTGCADVRGERVATGMSSVENVADAQQPSLVRGPTDAIEVSHIAESDAFSFSATELFTRRAVRGADLVDDGPVIITFVVPQCPMCISEGPELAESAANNPDVTYVFIHSGGTSEAYERYVSSSGLSTENVVHLDDSPGLLWARFGVIQQPTSVQIDASGQVTQSLGTLGAGGLQTVTARIRDA